MMQLPDSIDITEVCPRDGFQNHKPLINAETKKEIIDDLCKLGFTKMEITSFVSPKAIPQMSDAGEVVRFFNSRWAEQIEGITLIPNLKGAELALKAGARSLIMVVSASEKHNMANTGRTVADSLKELAVISRIKGDADLNIGIGTSFMCPFAGEIAVSNVSEIIRASLDLGISNITIADTSGTANPLKVYDSLSSIKKEFSCSGFSLHFHDTYGFGLANVLTALQLGYTSFESSAAGMGGCPFAPGATGNLATEDLVNMAAEMGIKTGINLPGLLEVSRRISKRLNLSLGSHLALTQLGL